MGHAVESDETVYAGWSRLRRLTIRLPDGQTATREVEDHGAAVAVLPYDPGRRVALLVELFRAPPFLAAGEERLVEAPAGLREADDPAEDARREALEEVGVRLGSLEPAGVVWTMPGISTERMHLFLAPFAAKDRVAAGGGVAEEHENIIVREMPLSTLAAMADAGEIADLKTFALVQTLRLRKPDLFA